MTMPPVSPRNPRIPLYYTVKHFYLEVEGSSVFSILVLQAGVLLALYELGHAIYPAAFLTIGACARYAHALGINVSRGLNSRRVLTLVEAEERRRVWWAIIILDRYVLHSLYQYCFLSTSYYHIFIIITAS
jgi:Fungal specific transcription factor domain